MINRNIIMKTFYIFFYTKSSKSGECFTFIVHLHLDAKFPLEIIRLYLEFTKFRVKKDNLPTPIVPNICKNLLTTVLCINF